MSFNPTVDPAFVARVLAWTGGVLLLRLEVCPDVTDYLLPGGQVITSAHEGRAWLFTDGDPFIDGEGRETYEGGLLLLEEGVAELYRHLAVTPAPDPASFDGTIEEARAEAIADIEEMLACMVAEGGGDAERVIDTLLSRLGLRA